MQPTNTIYTDIKKLPKSDLKKEKASVIFQHVNSSSEVRCFNFEKAQENKILTALEIKKSIHLAIQKSKNDSNPITMEKILNAIDEIQRDLNQGINAKDIIKTRLNEIFDNFGDQFYNTVILLATHQNHFFKTKTNWFGLNRTESIKNLKIILAQNPEDVLENYEDGFFRAAQVQNLPLEAKSHLRHAMTLLKSNGIFGGKKCGLKIEFKDNETQAENTPLKSARYGSCQAELYKNGNLKIKFYQPTYEVELNKPREVENKALERTVRLKSMVYATPNAGSSSSMTSS